MQGILKSNHQKLCDCVQDIKGMQLVKEHKLYELEEEWQSVFMRYQEKMNELKQLIFIYEEKQRLIRNEIKRIKKYTAPAPQKINHLMLGKVVSLVAILIQNDFIGMLA